MPTSLGNVAPILDGAWSNAKTYARNTIVTDNGSSYFSRKAVPAGTATSNTEYWQVSSARGIQGLPGTPGIPPVSGATSGNFPALDSSGNLTDSGKKVADFFQTAPDINVICDTSTANKWGLIARYVSPITTGYNGQISDAFRVLVRSTSSAYSGFGIFSIDIRNSGNGTYLCYLRTQVPLPQGIDIVSQVTTDASNITFDILMKMSSNPSNAIIYSLGSYLAGGIFTKTYMGNVSPSNSSLPTATATIYPEMQTAAYSTLTLLNSFTGWIRYTKSASSLVTVRFSITPGTTTDATQIAQLPSTAKPVVTCAFQLVNNTTFAAQNFRISATTPNIHNVGALTSGVTYTGSYTYLAE